MFSGLIRLDRRCKKSIFQVDTYEGLDGLAVFIGHNFEGVDLEE